MERDLKGTLTEAGGLADELVHARLGDHPLAGRVAIVKACEASEALPVCGSIQVMRSARGRRCSTAPAGGRASEAATTRSR